MPIVFLEGKVTKESFLEECKQRGVTPSNALLIFASNDSHHKVGKHNLYNYKSGSGQARLAGELSSANVATLGIPTMRSGCCGGSVLLDVEENVGDKHLVDGALNDMFMAYGRKMTIFIMVREQLLLEEVKDSKTTDNKGNDGKEHKGESKSSPDKKGKYFDAKSLFAIGKELSIFGGEVTNTNPRVKELGKYIMERLLLLEKLDAAERGKQNTGEILKGLEEIAPLLKKAYEWGVRNSNQGIEYVNREWFRQLPASSCWDCFNYLCQKKPEAIKQPNRGEGFGLGQSPSNTDLSSRSGDLSPPSNNLRAPLLGS